MTADISGTTSQANSHRMVPLASWITGLHKLISIDIEEVATENLVFHVCEFVSQPVGKDDVTLLF